MHQAEHN
jgi:hypothetical protein